MGRRDQLAELVAALPPHGDTAKLVTGDAGIGKSRLVSEVAAEAQRRGHRVVWGLCWDADGAPPFWPWTQIARTLLSTTRGTELGTLLLDDTTATRFDLFNAVADLLRSAQEAAPLVVVLEDLHEADQPSIALLRFLARHLQQQRILFVGTYRAGEVNDRGVQEQLELLGEPGNRIDLDGLSMAELRSLIPADGPDAKELHAITGGNPLFVEQIVRLGAASGELRAVDGPGVVNVHSALRSVTRNRLGQLPPPTLDALSAIAVRGRPAGIAELAGLLGEPAARLDSRLAPAVEAGILVASTTGTGGAIAFSHLLLADAALELTPPDRLRALHRRCAELLADQPGRRAERARHLLQAGAGHAEEALSACVEAGGEAMSALAFEDAVAHYRQALRVIDLFGAGDPAVRMRTFIDLGTAQWAAEDHADADATFRSAWEQAVRSGDAHAQALAALGPAFRFDFSGKAALERAQRCTTALKAMPRTPSPLRARLLAVLAAAQLVKMDQETGRRTAAAALAMAEELDDDLSIGYALVARIVTDLDPDTLDDRLSAARRILSIARLHGDRDLAANGYFLLLAALLEAGDIRAVDAELEPRQHAVDAFSELKDGRHAGWFRCSRTLLDGNAELAEQFANSSLETARRDNDPDAESVWVAQLSIVRWMQGRPGDVEPYYLQARREEPWRLVWIAILAWLWAAQGRLQEAEDAVASIGSISDIPRDRHWFLTMSALAEVVSITRDLPKANALRDELIPYARRLVPIGLGIAAWGTVARPLGLLARLLGREDEARAHFRQAVQVCTQAGALPWLVQSQLDLAEALRDRGGGEDLGEAVDRAQQAHATANALGLESFARRAEEVLLSLDADRSADGPEHATGSGAADTRAAIGVLGRFEVGAADGTTPRWTSRKARELLKILVAARGTAVSRERIMDILWPGEAPALLSNRMSVAISTVRRALDPSRIHPSSHYLRAGRDVLQLNRERLEIDVESFLLAAHDAIDDTSQGRDAALANAIARYAGDAFADEPYAEWAEQLRYEAQTVFGTLCRLRAESAALRGDQLLAAELHRRVLTVDRYDEGAHLGLVAALESLGVGGQARLAREQYRTRMSELAS